MQLLSAGLLAYCAAVATATSFGGPTRFEVLDYDPTPSTDAVVLCNGTHARFTVLTGALVRMQYFAAGSNVTLDPATMAFVNRKLEVPQFTSSQDGAGCTITTSEVALTYTGGPFTENSIKVVSVNASSAFQTWNGGMTSATDSGSLLGTFRTLDGTVNVTLNCTENKKEHCTWGVLSRSGWALVDDTDNAILDSDYDWNFDADGKLYPRQEAADWYLFAHGHNYRGALMDFGLVSGKPALPPRAALGVWFTRWFDYANVDVRDIVEAYNSRDIPLDVLVRLGCVIEVHPWLLLPVLVLRHGVTFRGRAAVSLMAVLCRCWT
jgi:alpha-glucosidase